MTVLYFKSRKNYQDKSTWRKETFSSADYTKEEIIQVTFKAGCEGYAIIDNFGTPQQKTLTFNWFVQ